MHPFSIESLTSPSTSSRRSSQGPGVTSVTPGVGLLVTPPSDPRVGMPQHKLSPVSPGLEGTGSRDCSPDNSFEETQEGEVVDNPPSPVHSEDSGRGTPDTQPLLQYQHDSPTTGKFCLYAVR